MRVPDLVETQAHLSQFGYEITRYDGSADGRRRYWLRDRHGNNCGAYKSLTAFWAFWLESASAQLRPLQLCEAFMVELADATPERREEMLDSFEGYYTGRSRAAFHGWEDGVIPFCPDELPEDWEIKLADQVYGRSARWGAEDHILDALCREKLDPSERWEKYRSGDWP